jgi:hypothetical protein
MILRPNSQSESSFESDAHAHLSRIDVAARAQGADSGQQIVGQILKAGRFELARRRASAALVISQHGDPLTDEEKLCRFTVNRLEV